MKHHSKNPNLPPLIFFGFLFLVTFSIYILTLNSSLFRNDSPETITACFTLGIQHAPSYPLFTLLGRLFGFLPIGNPAFVLNLLSAFISSIAICLFAVNLHLLIRSAFKNYSNSNLSLGTLAVSALIFTFSKSYWSNSLAAKGGIYTLQTLLILVFFACLQLRFTSTGKDHSPLACTHFLVFIFSLGLINHWPTQLLLVPAIFFLFFQKSDSTQVRTRTSFPVKKTLISTSFTFIVLSLYLYLPIRSCQFPELNFGAPYNFHRFLSNITRSEYGKIETLASAGDSAFSTIIEKADYISIHFMNETSPWFLILMGFGLYLLWKKQDKKPLSFLVFTLGSTLIASLLYLRPIPLEFWHMDDHMLTSNWVFCLLIGLGYFQIFHFLNKIRFWRKKQNLLGAAILFGTFLILMLVINNSWRANDQKREFLYYGYGNMILKSLPAQAVYFAESDYDYFSLLYFQNVEMRRRDVDLLLTSFLKKDYSFTLIRQNHPDLFPRIKSDLDSQKLKEGDFYNWLLSGRNPRPSFCAFLNGDFSIFRKEDYIKLSFEPQGLVLGITSTFHPSPNSTNNFVLSDFWERYAKPNLAHMNPINGLLTQICAFPYIYHAQYAFTHGDRRNWDLLYSHALELIQDKSWQANEWMNKAGGDLQDGKKGEALIGLQNASWLFLQTHQFGKALAAMEKLLLLDPTNLDVRESIVKLKSLQK